MYTVERSTTIDAPPERIYQQIANLHNWRNWSPWEGLDPDLRRIYSTKIMWFVKSMDAAPLTHPPHRDDRQSVDQGDIRVRFGRPSTDHGYGSRTCRSGRPETDTR